MRQHIYARAATLLLALFVSVMSTTAQAQPDSGHFKTEKGPLKCEVRDGVIACLGIPYAAPPIGALRFFPPTPAAAWTTERDATRFGSSCLQAETEYAKAQEGAEDCLYLNVYVPANPDAERRLPVMVWLHGGAFVNGSGNAFNGRYLAQTAGAIIVTVNYRLGPFGWLALPSLAAEQKDGTSGNYGLLDSIAALKWVQTNIGAFGGDRGRVTLFGQSAGGEQTFALLASPYAKDLFQRAISMSAPATLRLPTIEQAAAKRGELLAAVGCTDQATQPACLRSVNAQKLLDAARISWDLLQLYGLQYTPTIDGAVLPDQWLARFREGQYNKVPVIIGHTREEGRLFVAINENVNSRAMPNEYVDERMKGFYGPASVAVEMAYPRGQFPNAADRIARGIVDSLFAAGLNANKDALSRSAKVYGYEWCDTLAAESHVHARFSKLGCAHDADLPYLFQWDDFNGQQPRLNSEQSALALQMGRYFGAFAATGDPNTIGVPRWPAHQPGIDVVLLLETASTGGVRSSMEGAYARDHKIRFWSTLGTLRHPSVLAAIATIGVLLLIAVGWLARRRTRRSRLAP